MPVSCAKIAAQKGLQRRAPGQVDVGMFIADQKLAQAKNSRQQRDEE